MKTETNIINLKEQYSLDYSELQQISNDPDTGFIRLIGYLADYPVYRDKRWYLFADVITINTTANKIYRCEPVTSKGKDWVIDNTYKVMIIQDGQPILNPEFKLTEEREVQIGFNEETQEPIYETQNIDVPISLENSPFLLASAFDFYYGIRHDRELNMSMSTLWENAVIGDDMWEYFDRKESHYNLVEVLNIVYNQLNS